MKTVLINYVRAIVYIVYIASRMLVACSLLVISPDHNYGRHNSVPNRLG
jgi:hypothetical protein